MSLPNIDNKGTVIRFEWKDEMLTATVSRLSQDKTGTIKGQLLFETSNPEYHKHLLQQTYNFSSPRTQKMLKDDISKRYNKPEIDWDSILEQLSVYTKNIFNEGEAPTEVWTDENIIPLEYKLYPILPKGEPTILFADGGSGKSTLALFIACCITLPWNDNPLHLKPEFGKVLYLDWETNINTFKRRLQWLQHGHSLPNFFITYRRCRLSLSEDIEEIHRIIAENKIDTVIIDSVIGACEGDINKNEVAADFYRALRALTDTTTLAIHHVSKDKLAGSRSPFGSAYFSNLARSVWELTSSQEPGESKLSICLSHYKSNDDTKHQPIGMEVEYRKTEQKTIFSNIAVEDIPEAQTKLSLTRRIENELKNGNMGLKDIVDSLGVSYQLVANALSKMKRNDKVIRLNDGTWALPVKAGF